MCVQMQLSLKSTMEMPIARNAVLTAPRFPPNQNWLRPRSGSGRQLRNAPWGRTVRHPRRLREVRGHPPRADVRHELNVQLHNVKSLGRQGTSTRHQQQPGERPYASTRVHTKPNLTRFSQRESRARIRNTPNEFDQKTTNTL